VLMIDKSAFLGGNSTKATSGINGAGTRTQQAKGIADSAEIFERDTLAGARGRAQPALIKVLTGESGDAVHWLQDSFALDLSLVSRLGGHSNERTHRGKEKFPGMTITYALMEALEAECDKGVAARAKIISRASVTRLLQSGGAVTGVEYEVEGLKRTAHASCVVLATGGYAADFTEGSLLRTHRPDIAHLSTTNGPHCTGDGIKLGLSVGAGTIDMDMVQVHPTGLVDPLEPDAKVKFLAAEALRGCGGILLDGSGNRFCNELGHRDYVSNCMFKGKGPFRLILQTKAAAEINWHCKHYVGRGLMKFFDDGSALAREIGCSEAHLASTFAAYSAAAAAGTDSYGKKYFQNAPITMQDNFHVAVITPVLHYCMGGIKVGPDTSVLSPDGKPIAGLFAAGEVMGGVHGENRLGGSSLLDCVVFGRVAGRQALRLAGAAPVAAAAAATKQPPAATAAAGGGRVFSMADVAKHNTEKDCWVVVNGQVPFPVVRATRQIYPLTVKRAISSRRRRKAACVFVQCRSMRRRCACRSWT
jgi:flavocytochrome c